MAKLHTHYDTLEVHRDASIEVIRGAYRELCRKYHPDINRDPSASEAMKEINVAYEVLSNTQKRKEYDRWLQQQEEDYTFSKSGESNNYGTSPDLEHLEIYCKNADCAQAEVHANAWNPVIARRPPRMHFFRRVDVGFTKLYRYRCPYCHSNFDMTAGGTRVEGVNPGIEILGQIAAGFLGDMVKANPARKKVAPPRREGWWKRNWIFVTVPTLLMAFLIALSYM